MEEYEINMDVWVPVKGKKVIAENENEAIEKVQLELEKKGISKERISNLTWTWLSKKKPN